MRKSFECNSAHQSPLRLPLLTIGFCTDLAGEERLASLGIERIWRRGNGSESLEHALYDFRERHGALAFVNDTRIFGDTNAAISEAFDELERLEIKPIDIDAPWLRVPKLQERARKALHAATPMPNHRTARRRGRAGGLAKAANAAARRRAEVSDEIARKVWQSRLTKQEKAAILGCTISTGDRHYGVHAT